MRSLFTILVLPMFILNSLSGIVGGIWLLWLGEWKLVLSAFLALVASPLWASILLIPTLLLAAPSLAVLERGHIVVGTVLASISGLWTYAVVTGWCLAVFWYLPHMRHVAGASYIPYLLTAYALATGPWAAMAQREKQGGSAEGAELTVSAACVGCALILGYVFLSKSPVFSMAIWLLIVPMAAAYALSIAIALTEGRRRAKYGY